MCKHASADLLEQTTSESWATAMVAIVQALILYISFFRLSSLEPMEPFRRLRAVHLPQLPDSEEVLLDVTLQAEELSQQVQETIGMLALQQ